MALVLLSLGSGVRVQEAPPRVSGVGLGSAAQEIQGLLGTPDRVQESIGMRFWDYEKKGITFIWREKEAGVRGVVITRADAGPLRRVRVGDAEAVLRKEWGEPARIRQEGRFQDFAGAHWVLSAELHDHVVVAMTLMATVDARQKERPVGRWIPREPQADLGVRGATTTRRSLPSR